MATRRRPRQATSGRKMEMRKSSNFRMRARASSPNPEPLEKRPLPRRPKLSSRLSRCARERTDRSRLPSLDLSRHATHFSRRTLTSSMLAMSKRASCSTPSSPPTLQQSWRIRSADRALLASLPEPRRRLGPPGYDPFRTPNRYAKRRHVEPPRRRHRKALPRRAQFQIEATESAPPLATFGGRHADRGKCGGTLRSPPLGRSLVGPIRHGSALSEHRSKGQASGPPVLRGNRTFGQSGTRSCLTSSRQREAQGPCSPTKVFSPRSEP